MITIRLPYTSVPLRSNDRLHWRAKAVQVKAIREATALVGRMALTTRQLEYAHEFYAPPPPWQPIDYPVVVTLVWEVADRRVRDVGAGAPTLKAAIDGLVDSGVLSSDRHSVVTEERYRIEVGQARGVRIEISPVKENQ